MFDQLTVREAIAGSYTLVSNSLSLFLNKADARAPLYVFWLMTYRCNSKCLHCNWVVKNMTTEKLNEELVSKERLDVANQLAKSKTFGVTLSGGEPLLVREIFEVIKILKRAGKRVNVCTNGLLLEDNMDKVLKAKPDCITISLDSPNPEIHDKIRGGNGYFEKTISGIDILRKSRQKKNPKIIIKMTISKENIESIEEFLERFRGICEHITFQPVQNNLIHQVPDEGILFDKSEYGLFKRKMDDLMSKYPFMNNSYYKNMADFLFNPDSLLKTGKFRCLLSSAYSVYIDPYGNVKPCLGLASAGNFKESGIIKIWKSRENCRLQQKMRDKGNNCICWAYNNLFNQYLVEAFKILKGK